MGDIELMHCSLSKCADALLRGEKMPVIEMTKFILDITVVYILFHQLGTPVINLFATIKNRKLPVFWSPLPEKQLQ